VVVTRMKSRATKAARRCGSSRGADVPRACKCEHAVARVCVCERARGRARSARMACAVGWVPTVMTCG
jgi:hypothetical protein